MQDILFFQPPPPSRPILEISNGEDWLVVKTLTLNFFLTHPHPTQILDIATHWIRLWKNIHISLLFDPPPGFRTFWIYQEVKRCSGNHIRNILPFEPSPCKVWRSTGTNSALGKISKIYNRLNTTLLPRFWRYEGVRIGSKKKYPKYFPFDPPPRSTQIA